MRGHWNVRDFRQTDVLTLEFSPEQASEIRSTLLHNQPTLAVNAGAAGQTAP